MEVRYMFNVNDTILYGTHGICKITDITEQKFNGSTNKYYILQPLHNTSSTIYVPMDNEKLIAKMRRILSEEEIYELIKAMPDKNGAWIENKNERNEYFRSILSNGDRAEIIKLIKIIYQHKEELKAIGKKLHASDEQFFKEAEKVIYDEFALVLNIRYDQVLPFIVDQISLQA